MSRRAPTGPAPELPPRSSPKLVEETREFEFLTPMFGGGTSARESDLITPVRVPSIRGQLRFWWRAANPRGLQTVDELREVEAGVFGDTSHRSPLVVRVVKQPKPPIAIDIFEDFLKGERWRTRDLFGPDITYGAFPLRGERNRAGVVVKQHGQLHKLDRFTLCFRYPENIRSDVEAAVWAWSTFGGLGARTRRGFGAIQAVNQTSKLDDGFDKHVQPAPEGWMGWPRIRHFQAGQHQHQDALAAQQSLLNALRDMRQGEGRGRRERNGRQTPGRSYWPEPDALRRIARRWASDHEKPLTSIDAFPRAVFGLPIVFHFKDPGDPEDTHLVSVDDRDRWASPLVFRPLRIGEKYAAVAVELCPRPSRARIKNGREVDVQVPEQEARAMSPPRRPIDPADPHLQFLDPIAAFFRRIP